MRSDERDFVDDMLDDVTGGSVGVSGPPEGYHATPENTGTGGQQFNIGGASSGTATAGATGLLAQVAAALKNRQAEDAKRRAAAAAGQAGFSRGYTLLPSTGRGPLRAPGSAIPSLISAVSTPGVGGSGVPGLETHPVTVTAIPGEEGQLVGDMAAVTDPRLRSILGSLRAMRIQSQATSEHASLAAQDRFRKDVTSRLARIESRLPAGGLRRQVSLVRSRIIPIMLG